MSSVKFYDYNKLDFASVSWQRAVVKMYLPYSVNRAYQF